MTIFGEIQGASTTKITWVLMILEFETDLTFEWSTAKPNVRRPNVNQHYCRLQSVVQKSFFVGSGIRGRSIWESDKVSDATFVTIIKWTQSIFNLSFEVPIFHVWRIPCNKKTDVATRFRPGYLSRLVD